MPEPSLKGQGRLGQGEGRSWLRAPPERRPGVSSAVLKVGHRTQVTSPEVLSYLLSAAELKVLDLGGQL